MALTYKGCPQNEHFHCIMLYAANKHYCRTLQPFLPFTGICTGKLLGTGVHTRTCAERKPASESVLRIRVFTAGIEFLYTTP